VRRRLGVDPHDPMAKIVGDRFLLTTDAIAEELERIGRKPVTVAKCAAASPVEAESPEAEVTERIKRRLRSVR
jgi:DNA-binding ferritin-like protein